MDEERLEERLMKFNGHGYDELAVAMLEAIVIHDEAKKAASAAWEGLCFLTDTVIPRRLDADNVQNVTVVLPDGTKRKLLILDQVSVKTPANKKLDLYEGLRGHDAEHLITDTVNSSSLGGFVREQMRQGEPWPDDICDISTYSRASLRKA